MRGRRFVGAVPVLAGLILGLVALGPALKPGFVLRYDMVFVPDPPVMWQVSGFPRAVPSDLVVALLSHIAPAQVVQKLILVGIFVLAGSGAAGLIPGDRPAPRVAAAVFYVWNAYLAQRLLLGQWALLLGFAGLPWAVRAAARGGGPWRLALALLPAAIGGFQAMLVSALAVLPVAATRPGRRLRGTLEAVAVIAVLSLPWAIPALLSEAVTDPAGVEAFAPRADGPFGTVGSLLSLGGIWNAEADVPGQSAWWLATARLIIAVIAVAAFVLLPRPLTGGQTPPQAPAGDDTPPQVPVSGEAPAQVPVSGEAPYRAGLLLAACAGLVIALTGAYAPGMLKSLIAWWPGFGPLRDGQLYIAPLALVQAIGFGLFTGRVCRPEEGRGGVRGGVVMTAVVAALLPVLVMPLFAFGAAGRLVAVGYPEEWRRVQAIVNGDPRPGALLSLPWGAHRAFAWNGGRVILDPATKAFARRVVWNDALAVGLGRGRILQVAGEDRLGRRIGAVLGTRTGPLTAVLRAAGIRYVLIVRQNENTFRSRLPGAVPAFVGREMTLLRL
ncbi:hypothetical protein [Sphaerisporangium perillae]|uniref:hypothetical protein n=1 Tax=Sphaerisporangium perillae TaxID=2935860 RepID=UPI00200F54DD|nr:hypothetical protein [Sphaerisporangium perillae]